ncbi:MAG: hypothetical protein EP298_10130 [Gammaproteobacteria bacterium]|nr:MAG: hypothetical protein EP298_10130 [Gammaproteobacteria bacterium]UTW42133.1 hypothetical protein KFE69_11650 [bacterium SCSIO 12844]
MISIAINKALGYKPSAGLCFSHATLAGLANARGPDEFATYIKRRELLRHPSFEDAYTTVKQIAYEAGFNSIDEFKQIYTDAMKNPKVPENERFLRQIEPIQAKYLVNAISIAEKKRLDHEDLTEQDKILLSIRPFFDSVSLYMHLFEHDDLDIVTNLEPLQNKQNITQANAILNESNGHPISDPKNDHSNPKDFGIYIQAEYIELFTKNTLKQFLTDNLRAGLSFNFYCAGHAINVGFNGNTYYVINHDKEILSDHIDDILPSIMADRAMFENEQGEIIVYAQLLGAEKPNYIQKPIPNHHNINDLKKETQVGKLLNLAFRYGNIEAIQRYINLIKHSDTISLNEKQELFLSKVHKNPVILGYRNCSKFKGFSGLSYALGREHEDAIRLFIHEIKNFNFSEDEIEEILLDYDPNGLPKLHHLILSNYQKSIHAFISALADIQLPNHHNKNILLAYDKNKIPVLHFAFLKNRHHIIKLFVKGIDQFPSENLSDEDKKEILLAKNSMGKSGLHHALENENINTIESFISSISEINSSDAIKLDILLAFDGNMPGLYKAIQKNYIQSVDTYIKSLSTQNLSTEIKKQIILTNIYAAIEDNNSSSVIKLLNLSKQLLPNLHETQREIILNTLNCACQRGKIQTITESLAIIQASNLFSNTEITNLYSQYLELGIKEGNFNIVSPIIQFISHSELFKQKEDIFNHILITAIEHNHINIIDLLLRTLNCSNLSSPDKKEIYSNTLELSIKTNKLTICKLLLTSLNQSMLSDNEKKSIYSNLLYKNLPIITPKMLSIIFDVLCQSSLPNIINFHLQILETVIDTNSLLLFDITISALHTLNLPKRNLFDLYANSLKAIINFENIQLINKLINKLKHIDFESFENNKIALYNDLFKLAVDKNNHNIINMLLDDLKDSKLTKAARLKIINNLFKVACDNSNIVLVELLINKLNLFEFTLNDLTSLYSNLLEENINSVITPILLSTTIISDQAKIPIICRIYNAHQDNKVKDNLIIQSNLFGDSLAKLYTLYNKLCESLQNDLFKVIDFGDCPVINFKGQHKKVPHGIEEIWSKLVDKSGNFKLSTPEELNNTLNFIKALGAEKSNRTLSIFYTYPKTTEFYQQTANL